MEKRWSLKKFSERQSFAEAFIGVREGRIVETFEIRGGPTPAQIREALDGAFSNPRRVIDFPTKYGHPSFLAARVVGFEYLSDDSFGPYQISVEIDGYQRASFEYSHDHNGGRGTLVLQRI